MAVFIHHGALPGPKHVGLAYEAADVLKALELKAASAPKTQRSVFVRPLCSAPA